MGTFENLGSVATAALAVVAGIGLLWRPVRTASHFFRQIAAMARAIHGVPEDPQRPGSGTSGLLMRVDAIGTLGAATAAAVAIIQHEVEHNAGGSIKDAVKRLEAATDAIGDRTGEIKTDLATLATRLDHHIDNNAK